MWGTVYPTCDKHLPSRRAHAKLCHANTQAGFGDAHSCEVVMVVCIPSAWALDGAGYAAHL
jgi:hypothetical protein